MPQLTKNQKSPKEVEIFYAGEKIVEVINASVIFLPASADVINWTDPKEMTALSNFIAPIVASML